MIFQDPMSSLNPVLTIADQISETLRAAPGPRRGRRAGARDRTAASWCGIPDAGGGRRISASAFRRHAAARHDRDRASPVGPRLLIADEPTTALDVTIQAQILDLLRELQPSLGMSVILISHDMGVIAEFAQRVVVMYAGRVVETAPVKALFRKPVHPYTEGLLAAIPKLDVDVHALADHPRQHPRPRAVHCRLPLQPALPGRD